MTNMFPTINPEESMIYLEWRLHTFRQCVNVWMDVHMGGYFKTLVIMLESHKKITLFTVSANKNFH